MDKEIEELGRKCVLCIQLRPERTDPISPWRLTSSPGDRVHIDHFQFRGADFLVMVDSYSKWIEVFPVRTLTSKETIEKVCEYKSRFGHISTLVSDNGTAFSSDEFKNFCMNRGTKHLRTAPYSPCSNGAAENAVKTVKSALTKLSSDPAFQKKTVAHRLFSFLEMYRATKHATTNESPFKLMFGREMHIRFDVLKTDNTRRQQEASFNQDRTRSVTFEVGEVVYARDYRDPKKPAWVRATVVKKLGAVLYECEAASIGLIKRRSHQLLKYPYDDFDDEHSGATTNARERENAESSDESVYGDDFVEVEEPPRVGQRQPDGTYVTRSNRVVRPPRYLEGQ